MEEQTWKNSSVTVGCTMVGCTTARCGDRSGTESRLEKNGPDCLSPHISPQRHSGPSPDELTYFEAYYSRGMKHIFSARRELPAPEERRSLYSLKLRYLGRQVQSWSKRGMEERIVICRKSTVRYKMTPKYSIRGSGTRFASG